MKDIFKQDHRINFLTFVSFSATNSYNERLIRDCGKMKEYNFDKSTAAARPLAVVNEGK